MQNPRPSNILIRAFVLIFSSLSIFVLGSIFFNMIQQNRETPEGFEQGFLQYKQQKIV